MKLARFWAKEQASGQTTQGAPLTVSARGWSDRSLADAVVEARRRAEGVLSRLLSRSEPGRSYEYGERPMAELLVSELTNSRGETSCAITRNSYGSLVMNVAELMFVDVDRRLSTPRGFFASLFRKKSELPAGREWEASPELEPLLKFLDEQPDCCVRVYETRGGFRLLFTDRAHQPTARETIALMQRLGADPLYMKLCERQESFRARLSPKPWRCNSPKPPVTFPYVGSEQQRFEEWLQEYESSAQQYGTCHYLGTMGRAAGAAEFEPLIALHNQHTKAHSSLELA